MTLPSTIPTKHGEYFPTEIRPNGTEQWRGSDGRIFWVNHGIDYGDGGRIPLSTNSVRMTPDEIIEFLQAYKEATK